jgi:predicted DNA-binding transcriptional regulator AlpA
MNSTTINTIPSNLKTISEKELANVLGIHRSTLWRGIARGVIPAPVRVSVSRNRWLVIDIEKHLGITTAQ